MPTSTDIDYLDGEFTVTESEPATIAELAELVGEAAILDSAVADLRYRNKYPRVYKKVSDAIATDFPRSVKEKKTLKDGTTRDVLVSANDHLREYLATGDTAKAKLAELFASVGEAEPLYVKGERTGGGGKVPTNIIDAANAAFAAGGDGVDNIIAVIESTVPGYKVTRNPDGEATPDSLARGIHALDKHLKKAAPSALSVLKGS